MLHSTSYGFIEVPNINKLNGAEKFKTKPLCVKHATKNTNVQITATFECADKGLLKISFEIASEIHSWDTEKKSNNYMKVKIDGHNREKSINFHVFAYVDFNHLLVLSPITLSKCDVYHNIDPSENLQTRVTIYIAITIEQTYTQSNMVMYFQHSKNILCRDIANMYQSKDFSDISIRVENKVFKVHKLLIVSRSPVFKAMLSKETRKEIMIEGITPEIFEELLLYMYTARVKNIDKVTFELAKAAGKFELLGLKEICEEYIQLNMSREHLFSLLDYSGLTDNPRLADAAIEFVEKMKKKFSSKDIKILNKNRYFYKLFLKNKTVHAFLLQ